MTDDRMIDRIARSTAGDRQRAAALLSAARRRYPDANAQTLIFQAQRLAGPKPRMEKGKT